MEETETESPLSQRLASNVVLKRTFMLHGCNLVCIWAGKRDLPAQLRQRFTEIYVPEMTDRTDLQQLILSYLRSVTQGVPADAIIDFYLNARAEAVSVHHLAQTYNAS